jgi:hypothetical protein
MLLLDVDQLLVVMPHGYGQCCQYFRATFSVSNFRVEDGCSMYPITSDPDDDQREALDTSVIFKLLTRLISLRRFLLTVAAATIPTERPPLVGEVSANFCG